MRDGVEIITARRAGRALSSPLPPPNITISRNLNISPAKLSPRQQLLGALSDRLFVSVSNIEECGRPKARSGRVKQTS